MGDPIGATDAGAIIDAVKGLAHKPEVISVEGPSGKPLQIIVKPEGGGKFSYESTKRFVDEARVAPEFRIGTATMSRLPSFCEHVTRFKAESSMIFADVEKPNPRLVTVLDYHSEGPEGAPARCKHRTEYAFPMSDEWKLWMGVNGKPTKMKEFAKLIESRLGDIWPPAHEKTDDRIKEFAANLRITLVNSGDMYQLSRGITVNVKKEVAHAVSTSSGEGELLFKETHTDKAGEPLRIPGGFVIAIPVFQSGPRYQIAIRISYDVGDAGMVWQLDLFDVELVKKAAIDEACALVKTETGLPLLFGTPENS